MVSKYLNAKSTTGTSTRVRDLSPTSGMCTICIRNCPVLCEIGKSAFRGREVLYPEPEEFGESTAGSAKDYLLDWSHLQIMTSLLGAEGIEPDPDQALFPSVDISTSVGGIPIKIPVYVAGLGSTMIAKRYWDGWRLEPPSQEPSFKLEKTFAAWILKQDLLMEKSCILRTWREGLKYSGSSGTVSTAI